MKIAYTSVIIKSQSHVTKLAYIVQQRYSHKSMRNIVLNCTNLKKKNSTTSFAATLCTQGPNAKSSKCAWLILALYKVNPWRILYKHLLKIYASQDCFM